MEQEAGRIDSGDFDRVRRGFAPDQVAEYLKRVASSVLTLESKLEETRNELLQARRERDEARAELASANRDPNEDPSERVAELMRTFDQLVGDLQREAEEEAGRILTDVRTDADRILVHAREEAERITAQARDEANRAESDIAAMRASTLNTFRDIRRRTFKALSELESVIENGAAPERVVTIDEAEELDSHVLPQMPRPDL